MWDRIQRLELELAQAMKALNRMGDELLAVSMECMELRDQRDRARAIAVALEQENALLSGASPVCAVCAGVVVNVSVRGEAR